MKKKAFISILTTVILVWFLLSQIDSRAIITTLKDVQLHLVLLGFIFYALSYLFRALRFRVLLQKNIALATLFNIVGVHTMWTNLLPFRSGELSYLYLLKKKGGASSYLTGVPSLILARVFDLISISVLFVVSFLGIGTLPHDLKTVGFVILFLVFSILSFAFFLIWKRERFLGRLKYYVLKFKLDKFKLVQKMLGKGVNIIEGFETMKSPRLIFSAFLLSLISWLFLYGTNFVIWSAVGITLNIWQVCFISTLCFLLGLLPVNGLAGFGTSEGIWFIIMVWFGLTKEIAIVTGFQLHFIALFYSVVLGLKGYVSLNLNKLNEQKKKFIKY